MQTLTLCATIRANAVASDCFQSIKDFLHCLSLRRFIIGRIWASNYTLNSHLIIQSIEITDYHQNQQESSSNM